MLVFGDKSKMRPDSCNSLAQTSSLSQRICAKKPRAHPEGLAVEESEMEKKPLCAAPFVELWGSTCSEIKSVFVRQQCLKTEEGTWNASSTVMLEKAAQNTMRVVITVMSMIITLPSALHPQQVKKSKREWQGQGAVWQN
ncbi:hypothetical protein GCK32_001145 [Trichostrongylus colubriformis]|uniref:Uncharacterized protein n=1 Tax=Trichostrongylus colubriformis TaxID=6319 RepID=A0AAN8G4S1_TRICO